MLFYVCLYILLDNAFASSCIFLFSDNNKSIDVDWKNIIDKIDPTKTRNTVKHLTFYNAVNKIFKRFIL